jgi:Abnormal spindle-like microcephaly-assoc'd, ASPM-SPD-2-Hydin
MRTDRTQLSLVTIFLALTAALFLSGCAGQTGSGTGAKSLAASASSLSFGNVKVGGSSALGVTITNAAPTSIAISNVSISGAGYSASGLPTGQMLAPGQTATLHVTFTPSATGNMAGTVTVASNATDQALTVSLSGTGVQSSGAHSVMLSWMPSAGATLGYNVYRSSSSNANFTKLNSAPLATTQYDDSAVQAGQTYFYAATSLDSANVESGFSNQVSATIP